jgi:hypothetical protein
LLLFAGVLAIVGAPWWSFAPALFLGPAVLGSFARATTSVPRSTAAMKRRHTELGMLLTLGIIAVSLAPLTERYAGLVLVAYLIFTHIVERIVWARYLASTEAAR